MADFNWEDEKFPYVTSIMTEKMVPGFFQVTNAKIRQYFFSIAAELTVATFPIKRR